MQTEEAQDKIPILNFHGRNKNSPLKPIIEFVNKIHSRFGNNNNNNENENVFITFCEIMSMYQKKQITINEVDSLLRGLFQNDPDLYVESTRFTAADEVEDTEEEDIESEGEGEGEGDKGRTRRKHLYEETWEICETYKYELDMLYLRIKSTANKLEGEEEHVQIEQLQFRDFKCIELLYGEEDGEAMVQLLLSKPDHNAPTIKARMEKKCKQIERHKILMDRVWGEILEDIRERREQVRHSCFLDKVRREWDKCVYY